MKEIWKDIEGYEGLYQVSSHGRVKSMERHLIAKGGRCYNRRESILTARKFQKGYLGVGLYNGSGIRRMFQIHRLVAQAFIPNPQNFPQVNHKNENKKDNRAENLEWCTGSYNMNYGSRKEKAIASIRKSRGTANRKVVQMTLEGKEIARYNIPSEASRATGIQKSQIYYCCAKKPYYHTAGGYRWAFVEEDP